MGTAVQHESFTIKMPEMPKVKHNFKNFAQEFDSTLKTLKTQIVKPLEHLLPSNNERKDLDENSDFWQPARREPHFDSEKFFAFQAQQM